MSYPAMTQRNRPTSPDWTDQPLVGTTVFDFMFDPFAQRWGLFLSMPRRPIATPTAEERMASALASDRMHEAEPTEIDELPAARIVSEARARRGLCPG
jgi:hypothetical protein